MRFRDVVSIIDKSKKIGITYHVSPDGDALGSVLGLLQVLRKYGKEAYVISRDLVSDNLGFLPYSEEITGEVVKPSKDTDCVIVLDCGNVERISADLSEFKGSLMNIDHHLSNDKYALVNYVDSEAAATAEIIYMLVKEMNVDIDENIAKCLYTSLVTDTGSFRYSNSTERTHVIAGDLVTYIKHDQIHRDIFDNKPFVKMKLMALVLGDMKLVCNNKIVLMRITKSMLESIGEEVQNSSDVVSMGNQIKGVEGCILLKEVDEGVKVSFRSKDKLDVRSIAENFGGGGHTKAAGAFIKGVTIEEAEKQIVSILKKAMV